ncbi:MAG: signal peptidase I [Nanoarchaeota archaeon]
MKFNDFIKPNLKKIIIFTVLVILFSLTLKLSFGTYPYWYVVTSNVMIPNFSIGDIVFVQSTNYDKIEVNDVIVHVVQGRKGFLIMRVVSKDAEKRTFITKGDNNLLIAKGQTDLYETSIKAKIVAKLPYIGYLEIFHVGWIIRLIFIYILACFSSLLIKNILGKVK